jgi:hypothetical protein
MVPARRSNIDEHRACQADPLYLVYSAAWPIPIEKPIALQSDPAAIAIAAAESGTEKSPICCNAQ